MVATRGRTFKRPWRRSCLSSKLKSSSAPIGRKDSWCFHAVGSSNAPLLGSTAAEGLPRIGRTSIATRWRSCGLPQSASCSENFVIPPDVFGQTLRLFAPELRGEGYRAAPATGTAHRKQDLLLLLLVEIGAIDELPGLLLEQRMEREGAIRNLILGAMAGAAGLGRPCFVARRPRLFCLRLAIDLCAVLLLAAGPMLRGIHHVCAAPAGTVFRIGRLSLPIELHDTIPSSCVTDGRVFQFAWKALGSFLVGMGAVTAASEKNALDVGAKEMTGSSSGRARPGAIDFHAHVIVPEVYAVAAQHNVFSELPTDPGVTDEMRRNIKERAATVLARMSDVTERIGNMDAMGVGVQVLSASLVHQGLEWADAQTSLRLARLTNDWIAKAVAAHPARLIGLGTLPLHLPALAVGELARCITELRLKGVAISTTAGGRELGDPELRPFWVKAEALGAVVYIHP